MPRTLMDPNCTVRFEDGAAIFGLSLTTIRAKVSKGELPKTHLLSAPPSRARGWWGWQINEWFSLVEANQKAWEADERQYVPNNLTAAAKTTKAARK
jgi:predicted DNA-binding transcriptional regulator AlpA